MIKLVDFKSCVRLRNLADPAAHRFNDFLLGVSKQFTGVFESLLRHSITPMPAGLAGTAAKVGC